MFVRHTWWQLMRSLTRLYLDHAAVFAFNKMNEEKNTHLSHFILKRTQIHFRWVEVVNRVVNFWSHAHIRAFVDFLFFWTKYIQFHHLDMLSQENEMKWKVIIVPKCELNADSVCSCFCIAWLTHINGSKVWVKQW